MEDKKERDKIENENENENEIYDIKYNMALNEVIVSRIDKLRFKENKKISIYKLAKNTNIPKTNLLDIKNGKVKSISITTIMKICKACNTPLSVFFYGIEGEVQKILDIDLFLSSSLNTSNINKSTPIKQDDDNSQ